MNSQDSSPNATPDQAAFALTSDEEWVMVTQAEHRPRHFHFAIVRRETILMQGVFSLEDGQTLSDRLEQVSRELQRGTLHETFHKLTRALGVKIRKPRSCKGMCPWLCPGDRFDEINAKYSLKVPQDLRQRGLRLFQGWETPIITT